MKIKISMLRESDGYTVRVEGREGDREALLPFMAADFLPNFFAGAWDNQAYCQRQKIRSRDEAIGIFKRAVGRVQTLQAESLPQPVVIDWLQ